jgi:putative SOS response-associated peptidase YedK
LQHPCASKRIAECLICPFYFQSASSGAADSPKHWEKVWDSWRLLTMAGIFDCWEPPEGGDLLYSYTIITVDSCKALRDIHHRQATSFPL